MKNSILALLIALNTFSCFSQSFPKKQTLIPLSNVNGVPFYKAEEMGDIGINGFEIDDKGNFFFFGGERNGCLACFNGSKQVYRKNYNDLSKGSELHLHKNNMYGFTFDRNGNRVYIKINAANGSIIKLPNQFEPSNSSDKIFIDSCIIFEFSGANDSKNYYEQYTLTGKFIKKTSKITEIRSLFFPQAGNDPIYSFVGEWNDDYVFWGKSDLDAPYQLYLVDDKGKILAKRIIPKGLTGKGYFEEPDEDRKVRNGSFFVLGRKGNYALITEIPLASFFEK